MKSTGIVRRVDELGRVVIPKELRSTMQIREGDPLEIFTDQNKIILKKYEPGCVLCGSVTNNLQSFANKLICNNCIDTIVKRFEGGM